MNDGPRDDTTPEQHFRERDAPDSQRQHQTETVEALEERVGVHDVLDDVVDDSSPMTPDEDVTTESAPDPDDEEDDIGVSVNEPPA